MRFFFLVLAFLWLTAPAFAHHPTKNQYTLQVENHSFAPLQLAVPANTPFKLIIASHADQPVTFASETAQLSKTILPDSAAVINVPALTAGQYPFTVSAHTMAGVITAIAHGK